jgi:hypothetical protein
MKSAGVGRLRRVLNFLLLVALALFGPLASAQVNVTTYHNDPGRSGANTQETLLYPANVNSKQFGKLFTSAVDGYVYAQPLYMANIAIAGGKHNVLYVATEHDSVYAIDADSGVVYWQKSLIPSGGRTVNGSADIVAGCDDTVPEIGITGTPVIDPATNTLYVVAASMVGGSAVQYLHALDLASAAEKFGAPALIQAAVPGSAGDAKLSIVSFNPLFENQRAGLLLENGHVIIAWASHCDADPWHGWVMSYGAGTLAQEAVYNSTPNGGEGGIWMSGGGVAADAAGNLFFTTGNGDWNGTTDLSDSVVKLGPPANGAFPVLDYFTPFDQASLAAGDIDVASSPPILLPTLPSGLQLLAQMGKTGTIFVLNRANLGKYCVQSTPACTNGDPQIVQEIPNATTGVWGSPVYWNGSLYWGGQNDRMTAFAFNTTSGHVTTSATSVTPQFFGYPAPTPSLSSNGTSAGIVWALDASANGATCVGGLNCQVLYAYDATNLAVLLYASSQAPNLRDVPGSAVKFATPTVANGKVYVGSQYAVSGYGALPNVTQVTIAPVLTPAAGTYTSAQTVTITDAIAGAIIYYTTDGTTPTSASPVYTGPISITTTMPILAVAIANGYGPSSAAGGNYLIDSPQATTPQPVDLSSVFNTSGIAAVQAEGAPIISGGLDGYGDAFSAKLLGTSLTFSGVTYSLGLAGEFSGASSTTVPLPTGNFANVTLLASAVNGNQLNQTFTLNYADGTFTNFNQNLSDWCKSQSYAGESIALKMPYRVTASGSTQGTTVYVYAYSFAIPAGETAASITLPPNRNVVVLAVDVTPSSQPATATAAAPTFSPIAGTYTSAQTVALSDPTPGALLYYTLDGSTPTTNSTQYTAPVPIAATTTVSTLAVAAGYAPSAVASASYTIAPPGPTGPPSANPPPTVEPSATASPSFSPPPGSFTSAQSVALADATAGAVIYYTLDGSTPTSNSMLYAGPISVSATTTIKAFATADGATPSAMVAGRFAVGPPSVTTPEGVDLSQSANVDGLEPAGTPVTGPGLDGHGNAYAADLLGSTLTSQGDIYSIAPAGPNSAVTSTTIPLPAGSYASLSLLATGVNGNQRGQVFVVTYGDGSTASFTQSLSDWYTPQQYSGETTALAMAYRVKSSGVTEPGPVHVYSYAFALNPDETVASITLPPNRNVAVVAIDLAPVGGNVSPPLTATPTFSLAAGTFSAPVSVALTDATPGAVIYYTTDDTVPSTGSPQFAAGTPLVLTATTTLNAFAAAPGATTSAVTTAVYSIVASAPSGNTPSPAPASPTGGPTSVGLTSTANLTGIGTDGTVLAGGGIDGNGDAYSSQALGSPITWGGSTFQLGRVSANDAASATTIALPAGSYRSLQLLATGVNGNQPDQTFVVTYVDGSSTTITQSLSDWFTPQSYPGEAVAVATAYRLNRSGIPESGPFNVYGYTFALDPTKTVQSLTLPANPNVVVLALDLLPPPIYALVGIGTDGTALGAGLGGIDGNGNTYSSVLLGNSLTWSGATFAFGAAGSGDAAAGVTIPLTAGQYGTLQLLGTGVNGNQPNQTLIVNYADGTAAAVTQSFSDWFTPQNYPGEASALATAYRLTSAGSPQPGPFTLYGYSLALDPSKTVQSLKLPANRNVVVLGVNLAAGAGTVPVSTPPPATTPPATTPPATGGTSGTGTTGTGTTGTGTGTSGTGTNGTGTGTGAAAIPVGLLGTNNVYGIGATGTPVGGGGIDGYDNAFANAFLGTQLAWSGETFTLETAGPASAVTNTTIPLPSGSYSSLMWLGTGVNGNQTAQNFVVTYADGSTATYTQSVSDWFTPMGYTGEAVALATAYRINAGGGTDQGPFNVYGYSFALDATKSPVSLTLPPNPNVVVLAVDLAP